MRQSCGAMLMSTWHLAESSLLPRLKVRLQLLAIVCGFAMFSTVPVLSAQPSPPRPRHNRKMTTAAPPAVSLPKASLETAPPAADPLTSEEAPPNAPQVTWDGSQLTIITDNSTLSDILAAVHAHTGAEIDLPEAASRQRMAARLGPGPVREVLSTLLSWTGFNYVVQASDKDPDGIQSILLTPRPKDAIEVATNSARPSRREEYQQSFNADPNLAETQAPPETPVSTQSPTVAVEAAPPSEPSAQSPPAGADTPPTVADLQPSPANSQPAGTTTDSNSSLNQSKVPAKMIEQLQSMYQQRLQLQESQKSRTDQSP